MSSVMLISTTFHQACVYRVLFACLYFENINPLIFPSVLFVVVYFILCTAVPGKWMSAGTKWQTSLFTVNGHWGRPLPFFSLKVQRLFSYVTVALIQCVLIPSLFSPCQHRCSDGRLGPFLICDICRSRPLHCSRGAEARGPPSGIWGRYGMV